MTTTLREVPVAVFGGWQVFADCIRHDGAHYELSRRELTRPGARWDAHLAEKRWCKIEDFEAARAALLGEVGR